MSGKRRWDKVRPGYGGFDEAAARDWRNGPREVDILSIIPSDVRPLDSHRKTYGYSGLGRQPEPIYSETIDSLINSFGREKFYAAVHGMGLARAFEHCLRIKLAERKPVEGIIPLGECSTQVLLKRHEIKEEYNGLNGYEKRLFRSKNECFFGKNRGKTKKCERQKDK